MNIYSSTKVSPYVYICIHKVTKQFYIGYREKNIELNRTSDVDLPLYRTSSKVVNPNFDNYNWYIVAEFSTGNDAYDFEQTLIFENWDNPLLLNETCQFGKSRFKSDNAGKPKSEKHREKLKIARQKRAPHSEETKKKIALGNKGKTVPEESRKLMSNSKKGVRNPMFGKIVDSKTQELKRIASKKYYQTLADQNIPHPSLGFNQIRVSCLVCKKDVAVNIFSRFHSNNCKQNKGNS